MSIGVHAYGSTGYTCACLYVHRLYGRGHGPEREAITIVSVATVRKQSGMKVWMAVMTYLSACFRRSITRGHAGRGTATAPPSSLHASCAVSGRP